MHFGKKVGPEELTAEEKKYQTLVSQNKELLSQNKKLENEAEQLREHIAKYKKEYLIRKVSMKQSHS